MIFFVESRGQTCVVATVFPSWMRLFRPDSFLSEDARPTHRCREHRYARALLGIAARSGHGRWSFQVCPRTGSPAGFESEIASAEHGLDDRARQPDRGRSPAGWQLLGRLVESCVGAHLLNTSFGTNIELTYWRERNQEVDFVLRQGKTTVAIEVKSGRRPESLPGWRLLPHTSNPSANCSWVDRELSWLNFWQSLPVIGCNKL